ncbi:zinc ribbon domain-containing protein [Streptomyces sp. NK08204]|uniref:zinc ribbon domain-containing protein n=1 Tax=Streptomyces sp. NK08204 TaxID=2873260 RepID=UPI0035A960EB
MRGPSQQRRAHPPGDRRSGSRGTCGPSSSARQPRKAGQAADAAIGASGQALFGTGRTQGRDVPLVHPAHTTTDCGRCGARTKHALPLSGRTYPCTGCGVESLPVDRSGYRGVGGVMTGQGVGALRWHARGAGTGASAAPDGVLAVCRHTRE